MPIFSPTMIDGYNLPITTQNTEPDGSGTPAYVVVSPQRVDTYWQNFVVYPQGVNDKTVMRFWTTGEIDNSVPGNNRFLKDLELPATPTLLTDTAYPENVWKANLWLPAGHQVYVTLGATVAAGFVVRANAGDYWNE